MVQKSTKQMIALVASVAIILSLSSCESQLEDELMLDQSAISLDTVAERPAHHDAQTTYSSGTYCHIETVNSPYPETTHGRPNQTYYKFYVASPPTNLASVEIIFTAPDGNVYNGFYMSKNVHGNFFLKKKLVQPGRYLVQYKLYYTDGTIQLRNPSPNYVDNTVVDFSGTTKKLVWPFSADGSSYSNHSNNWTMTCGNGCYYHTWQYNDYYALDYAPNNDTGGAEVRSPLDGYVVRKTYDSVGGNLITIKQSIGDQTYYYQVGHLQSLPTIAVGAYVQAGVTKIGNVGKTGTATSFHAHNSLKKDGIWGISTSFDFSAQ